MVNIFYGSRSRYYLVRFNFGLNLIKKNDIFYDKEKLSVADIERQFLLFLCTLKYEGQEM